MTPERSPDPEENLLRLNLPRFLRGTRIVFLRELGAIFDSPIAYIYFIVFIVSTTSIFMNEFFLRSVVDMTPYFTLLPILSIVFMPALTMRVWAEEKRGMTFELIMTLPLHPFQVVLGKYFAILAFYLITLGGTFPLVIMLFSLGQPDVGLIFASYLGASLLGGVFMALGIFASGLTSNQIVAFVLAAFLDFLFVFTGHEKVVSVLDGLWPGLQIGTFLYESISIMPRYEALTRGVMRAGDMFYFLAMIGLFVWMNGIVIMRNRD